MRHLILTTICIPLFFLSGCGPSIGTELQEAERLMASSPDSSLLILQDMEKKYPEMRDEEKALFGLLYFQALDSKALELSPIEYIDFSIDYYSGNGPKNRLAYCYLYKSRIFRDKREYASAIQNLLNSKRFADPQKDNNLLGKVYFDLGRLSSFQGEYEKTLQHYGEAIEHYEKAGDTASISKIHIVTGWLHMAMENFDDAIQSSQKALEITTDSIIIGDALNDLGNAYFYKDEIDSALFYMQQSIHYPHFKTNESLRLYNLGNVYSYIKEYDSAAKYINKALQLPIDIYIEEECYRVMTRVAIAKDDKEKLTYYISRRTACQDSIRVLEQQPNIKLLEKMHYADIETADVKSQRLLLIFSIISLLLIACLIFLLFNKRNKKKQLSADIKANTYRSELEKKQELLLLELADELEQTKAKYAETRKKANFEQREQIDKRIYNEVLHIDDEKTFTDKMNKILNHLPEKLRKCYPEITYKEILWCCLFMLDFSTADISLIMDYKQSSQYKFKQRLSKKLNLNNVKELEDMLHEKVNI